MMLQWISDPQLWSGIWGAIFGAVLGGLVTLLILWVTIVSQKRRAEDEADRQAAVSAARAEQQMRDSRAQLEQQAKKLAAQLSAQRDERRESREIEAVGDLLQFVTTLVHQWPVDLSFVPELVRRCDQLTLSANDYVGGHWRVTKSRDELGVTRHPLAEALTVALALEQVAPIGVGMVADLYGGEIPTQFRKWFGPPGQNREGLIVQLNYLSKHLLRWQFLSDAEKLAAFSYLPRSISARAGSFIVRSEFFSHECAPFTARIGGLTESRRLADPSGVVSLLLGSKLPVQVSLINRFAAPELRESYAGQLSRLRVAVQDKLDSSPTLRVTWEDSLTAADAVRPYT